MDRWRRRCWGACWLPAFAGWLLASWAIIGLFLLLDLLVLRRVWGEWRSHRGDALGGLALLAGVLAFNIVVAFAIGQAVLGVLGCLVGRSASAAGAGAAA